MVYWKQATQMEPLLICTIDKYCCQLCRSHQVQPLAKNRIINEYGFLCLQSIVVLFHFIFQSNVLNDFTSTSYTHKERRLNATIFVYFYIFDCGRSFRDLNTANFHINIQKAKTCMTSDVMQQI